MLYVIWAVTIGQWLSWTDGALQPSGVPKVYCRCSGSGQTHGITPLWYHTRPVYLANSLNAGTVFWCL